MKFVRINRLTMKVDNILEGDETEFKNRLDYDLWIASDTAQTGDTYSVASSSFSSPPAYPVDGDKRFIWNEDTTAWVEIV